MKLKFVVCLIFVPFFLFSAGINFSFDNDELTNEAGIDYLEFDIMATAVDNVSNLGTGIVLIDYNVNAFGQFVSNNNKLTVSKRTLLENAGSPDYNLIQNDNQASRFAITFEYTSSAGWGNLLLLDEQQLMHIKLEIADTQQTSDLSFDADLMIGLQYQDDNSTKYDPVTANDVLDVTLPVTLVSFTGFLQNSLPTLIWTTQTETENLGWNVLRSNDNNGIQNGNYFITNNELIPGMNTVSTPTNYLYIDEYPISIVGTYYYWLQSISFSGEIEYFGPVSLEIEDQNIIHPVPSASFLKGNYPNPFNPETNIVFGINENESGIMSIYNVKGQIVLQQEFDEGYHNYLWHASNYASGIYYFQLKTPSYHQVRKMILLK